MTTTLPAAVETTPEVDALLAAGAPVAAGVSGGKDSCALGFALAEYLDRVGHTGPRLLVHSDLGRVEWRDSLPTCQRLADAIGWELVVVKRKAGDMLDRWQGRWRNNLARYRSLSCVKLILPWSTPSMRFCTSELKVDVITAELTRRFPGSTILNASGIRRDESTNRAKSPVCKPQPKLGHKGRATDGLDWHPILGWTRDDVFGVMAARGFRPHEAYARYGSGRVSCAYCIMSTQADLRAAAGCLDNHDLYREMVGLEVASTFAFQGGAWLGDVAPGLLDHDMAERLEGAKARARERERAEAFITTHLLYTKGWPTCLPTTAEADLLASVRRRVAAAVGIDGMTCLDGPSVARRYQELMDLKASKGN